MLHLEGGVIETGKEGKKGATVSELKGQPAGDGPKKVKRYGRAANRTPDSGPEVVLFF